MLPLSLCAKVPDHGRCFFLTGGVLVSFASGQERAQGVACIASARPCFQGLACSRQWFVPSGHTGTSPQRPSVPGWRCRYWCRKWSNRSEGVYSRGTRGCAQRLGRQWAPLLEVHERGERVVRQPLSAVLVYEAAFSSSRQFLRVGASTAPGAWEK